MSRPKEKGWHLPLYWNVFWSEKKGIPDLFWRQEGLVGKGEHLKDLKVPVSGFGSSDLFSPILVFCAAPYTLPHLQDRPAAHSGTSPNIKTKFQQRGKPIHLTFLGMTLSISSGMTPPHLRREGFCVFVLVTPTKRHIKKVINSIKLIWHARWSTC